MIVASNIVVVFEPEEQFRQASMLAQPSTAFLLMLNTTSKACCEFVVVEWL